MFSRICFAVAAGLMCAGAGLADPVHIETATGPVTLDATPKRIVALDVAAIDTLSALGVPLVGVVAPLYVAPLAEQVAGIPVVGTLFEPDFEKIAVARPEVIVVGGRSVAQARPLAGIAPVLDMSIGPDAVGDALARLTAYGALTGDAEQAEALAAELEAKLETARARVAGQGGALILMTNGPKLSVFGRGSRFGWLHSRLGWPEAVEHIAASPHGEPVSFEYLAEANPDWLIVIDRGQAVSGGSDSARATLDNDLMRGVAAVQAGQVLYLDPADIYVAAGGVGAMGRTLDQIIDALPPAP